MIFRIKTIKNNYTGETKYSPVVCIFNILNWDFKWYGIVPKNHFMWSENRINNVNDFERGDIYINYVNRESAEIAINKYKRQLEIDKLSKPVIRYEKIK